MQQRQPRLGDILDDYCPRERRLTNHAVVAMIGDAVKQTRCTTCEADHEYKHAKIPRPRRKPEPPSLAAAIGVAPKRVVHESMTPPDMDATAKHQLRAGASVDEPRAGDVRDELAPSIPEPTEADAVDGPPVEEGPAHRPLIRAQLPRLEGQPPASRPAPDFTIRQPTGRQNRFRPRQQRGGGVFQPQGNRSFNGNGNGNGNVAGNSRGGGPRHSGGRPQSPSRPAGRHGGGRHSK